MIERKSGIPVTDLIAQLPQQATYLGDFLQFHDKKYSLERDQALSIAFPTSGKRVDKSELRFGNQFIARVDKYGKLSGMLHDFKFINWMSDDKSGIALTEEGWRYSQLINPVLDGIQEFPYQKFNIEEIEYLIKHIRKNVQAEASSYRLIIASIKDGNDTPSLLDEDLMSDLDASSKANYSKSFLSSQRSGAVSRMIDVGLIKRLRMGKYVRYEITKLAEDFS